MTATDWGLLQSVMGLIEDGPVLWLCSFIDFRTKG